MRARSRIIVLLSPFLLAYACVRESPRPRIVFPAEPAVLEAHLGTTVEVAGPMVVTDVYALGRHGRLGLAATQRLIQPTNGTSEATEAQVASRVHVLVLDDGRDDEYPDPLPYWLGGEGAGRPPRVGDRVDGLVGRLERDEDGAWCLQPVAPPQLIDTNPRPWTVPAVGGTARVAAFNVLNYFETLDARGASNATELTRQRQKLLAALTALDADVLALLEVENTPGVAESLVAALAEASGQPWRAVGSPAGGLGDNAIRVALAYREDRVAAVGDPRTVADSVFTTRYPLAQTFAWKIHDGGAAGGDVEQVTVVTAHLKSKGGCGDAVGPDRDQGDGQGCWNDLRTRQANRLESWIDALRVETGDDDVLLVGDLNAYGAEDPIRVLIDAGWVDAVAMHVAPDGRYSYVYRGRSGTLDYALATPSLAPRVAGAAIWHINADEAPVLDYNTETNLASLYRVDPFRSSDHDPVIVGLSF